MGTAAQIQIFALFFSLLNPFLMSMYMIGMIRNTDAKIFNKALIQGSLISLVVFVLFAWGGESIFNHYLKVRFEAFQIFGGIIFLVIGYRYVFEGAETIGAMRGAPEHLASTIAMPYIIGPGTISAAVVTGVTLPIVEGAVVIGITLLLSCLLLILMKFLHDNLVEKYSKYVDRYVDIMGRLASLLIGTIAVNMIITGILGVVNGG
ncbi:MAG: MarC family protein [Acinetobacter sp.]|nr:MarC family protein [Acinetobacter sp.]